MCSRRGIFSEDTLADLKRFIERDDRLLLPLATVYETGNHIAQQGDGRQRRAAAQRFVQQARQALRGESPFNPTQIHQMEEVSASDVSRKTDSDADGFADYV